MRWWRGFGGLKRAGEGVCANGLPNGKKLFNMDMLSIRISREAWLTNIVNSRCELLWQDVFDQDHYHAWANAFSLRKKVVYVHYHNLLLLIHSVLIITPSYRFIPACHSTRPIFALDRASSRTHTSWTIVRFRIDRFQSRARKPIQQHPRCVQEDEVRHQHCDDEGPRRLDRWHLTQVICEEYRRGDFQAGIPVLLERLACWARPEPGRFDVVHLADVAGEHFEQRRIRQDIRRTCVLPEIREYDGLEHLGEGVGFDPDIWPHSLVVETADGFGITGRIDAAKRFAVEAIVLVL